MECFVNLPLSWVARDPAWLDWFIGEGVSPELGLDEAALEKDRSWHENTARRLRDAGLPCAVHLPFMGLSPADGNAAMRKRSIRLLRLGAERAALYGARHMIGHPGYIADRHGTGAHGHVPQDEWLARSQEAWRDVPELGGAPLFLENIHDPAPTVLSALLRAVGGPGVGICFDAGHWHSFSKGAANRDLAAWIDAFSPWLRHLHLHDNDGNEDAHLGLGRGTAPFSVLADLLRERVLAPTVTYEPHTMGAFRDTAAWFRERPEEAVIFRWSEPCWSGRPAPSMQ